MGIDVKGFVFIKESKDPYETIDKVKKGVEEFYRERLINAIKKEHPNDHENYRILKGVLSEVEKNKFESPVISYSGDGMFYANLSFESDMSFEGSEKRMLTFLTNINEKDNKNNDSRMGVETEDNEKLGEFKNGVWLSLGHGGSAPEIMISVLKQFGDEHPSYLIRNDCADSFNEERKNVVKIGSAKDNLSPVSISEEEYSTIRNNEKSELKDMVFNRKKKEEVQLSPVALSDDKITNTEKSIKIERKRKVKP